MIGIGDCQQAGLKDLPLTVYIANRPPIDEFQKRASLEPLEKGELTNIVNETGNHWRKIFNIYAKLGYLLNEAGFDSWQAYRDGFLLQTGSSQRLLFDDTFTNNLGSVNIICGKAHAAGLLDIQMLTRIDDDFAIDNKKRLIVCPYFDYRQLSNAKLNTLVGLIKTLL